MQRVGKHNTSQNTIVYHSTPRKYQARVIYMAQYVPDFVNIFEQLSDPPLDNDNMIILAKLIRLLNNSFSSKVRVVENSKFHQTEVICVNSTQQNKIQERSSFQLNENRI